MSFINQVLWLDYLKGRGINKDLAEALVAGNVKVKNGIKSTDADAVNVGLDGGLDQNERTALGLTTKLEDKIGNLMNSDGIIVQNELKLAAEGMKKWGERNHIDSMEVLWILYANQTEFHMATNEELDAIGKKWDEANKAEQDKYEKYTVPSNQDKTYVGYLQSRGADANSLLIKELKPESPSKLLFYALVSTYDKETQEKIFYMLGSGRVAFSAKYVPDPNGYYSEKNIEEWIKAQKVQETVEEKKAPAAEAAPAPAAAPAEKAPPAAKAKVAAKPKAKSAAAKTNSGEPAGHYSLPRYGENDNLPNDNLPPGYMILRAPNSK